jgi:hypothetical protein
MGDDGATSRWGWGAIVAWLSHTPDVFYPLISLLLADWCFARRSDVSPMFLRCFSDVSPTLRAKQIQHRNNNVRAVRLTSVKTRFPEFCFCSVLSNPINVE